MPFSELEKQKMINLKGVGITVVYRLEQIGFSSLRQLVDQDPEAITLQISQMMGSTCWHNSPQARAAIKSIIGLANDA
jgi:hypothetical protein